MSDGLPISVCHCYLDDGTQCLAPAVADSHDPEDPYSVTPVCADHALELSGTTVPRDAAQATTVAP